MTRQTRVHDPAGQHVCHRIHAVDLAGVKEIDTWATFHQLKLVANTMPAEAGKGRTESRLLPMRYANLLMLIALSIVPIAQAKDSEAKYDSTSAYQSRDVAGWTVLVNKSLLESQPAVAEEAMTLLGHQLYLVQRHVPREAVTKLQTVKIWVEEAHPKHKCMCYHPDAAWLRKNDMNPEKAGGVEIANVKNFLSWTIQQPYMVLHEMAHAYHHQFLPEGYRNAEVREAYERAMQAKSYEKVLRINGRDDRHYATTNPMEYFAEASEAYFGTNDFYPYVRSELQRHDPAMCDLLGKLWRVNP